MTNCNSVFPEITIGLDLGDKWSHYSVLDIYGEVKEEGRVKTTPTELKGRFEHGYTGARIAIEVGTHSPWVSRLLEGCGLEVIVANPRQVPLISENIKKSDQTDPELLARMARSDPKLLKPIEHRDADTQKHLSILRSRDNVVAARTKLINHVRGAVKSFGASLKGCTADNFHKQAPTLIPGELKPALQPILEIITQMSRIINQYDKAIEKLCDKTYSETDRLRQIKGVGPITALAYVLILGDPVRFQNRRQVGAYLGLVPKKQSSGAQDPQLRISKAGDSFLRRLLVSCAQYIMGPFGEDCDLRRHGEKIALRGGKNAKKRAMVAVARKLAVLLHALWCSGEKYEPLRNCKQLPKEK